jgi:hypothetical protein
MLEGFLNINQWLFKPKQTLFEFEGFFQGCHWIKMQITITIEGNKLKNRPIILATCKHTKIMRYNYEMCSVFIGMIIYF